MPRQEMQLSASERLFDLSSSGYLNIQSLLLEEATIEDVRTQSRILTIELNENGQADLVLYAYRFMESLEFISANADVERQFLLERALE